MSAKITAEPDNIVDTGEGLTDRQKRFCQEYLVDHVAVAAARRAGYSPGTAGSEGNRLLKLPHVQAYVRKLLDAQAERLDLRADKVIKHIEQIAYSDIRNAFDEAGNLRPPHEWCDETAAAIVSVDVVTAQKGEGEVEYVSKIKRADRLKALEMLARHFTLFNDKVEVNNNHGDLAERILRARQNAGIE